jgi:hypothetical protein
MCESIVVICPTTQVPYLRQNGMTGNSDMACMQKIARRANDATNDSAVIPANAGIDTAEAH